MIEAGLIKVAESLGGRLVPGLLGYLKRPRLTVALRNTDSQGVATGELTPWGEGGAHVFLPPHRPESGQRRRFGRVGGIELGQQAGQ